MKSKLGDGCAVCKCGHERRVHERVTARVGLDCRADGCDCKAFRYRPAGWTGVTVLQHGLSRTPEYRAWQLARLRCTSPTHPAYASYGGRGITFHAAWLDDPAAFIAHVGPRPSPKHEIDRIDNDRGYEPGNVRWATRKENDRNRRSNRMLTCWGATRTLVEWCERLGLRPDTVSKRLDAGWTVERALTTAARPKAPNGSARRAA